ncbi:hypothetical protein TWF281_001245 [Arthrobotrys megalospora]
MSKPNPKFLGRGGRRSLSDAQVGRLEISQGRSVHPPARTVSLASPGTASYLPLGERAPVDLHQRLVSTSRPIPQAEVSGINHSQTVEFQQEYEIQPRRTSGTTDPLEECSEHQMNMSVERRKENVAPAISQQPRVSSAAYTTKETSQTDEQQPARPPTPYPIASGRAVRESIELSHRLTNDPNRSTASLNLPLREDLLHSLQSMYGSLPSELTSNLEFLRAIEDPFDAKYTTAFDVFYNTRRFFDKPSGTILDVTSDEPPIGSGTVSGKSIYGIFIDDSLLYEATSIMEPKPFIPPTLLDTNFFPRETFQSSTTGSSGIEPRVSFHQKSLTIPSRRLHRPQLSESIGYNSLPRCRKVAGRDIITSPIRLRPTFRISPPRSPSFGMRKKTSTLRPRAVMAWWKEREAAASRSSALGHVISKSHFNEQPKLTPPNDEPERKEKEKRGNPLRRLSSLFGKRQSSETSLRSMTRSNGSHRSLNSLPSQVSLPECPQGIPSFITANIVRNSRVPSSAGENVQITTVRRTSESSSVVQQRISSFEAPRPIRVEKKYQTSPSYQLLSTLKPVRGRSLKEQFEKELGSGTGQPEYVDPKAVCEEIPARTWEVDILQAPVTSSTLSSHEASASTCQIPAVGVSILDVSSGSDSIQLDRHSMANSPFTENFGGEGNSGSFPQEIYDAELVLSSPDFSDPQIVTSTPLLNSGLSSPLIPQSISILGDSHSSHGLNSSPESSINSHHHVIPLQAIGAIKSTSSNKSASVQKPINSADKTYNTSTGMNITASDDNKENVAPDENLPNLPSLSPYNTRRVSVSSILGFVQGETNTHNMGTRFRGSLRRQNRGWQRHPLRMVKSALGSFGLKDTSKPVTKDQNEPKRKRPSVLDLFKFSRPADATASIPTPSTPSFRILPTVDSASLPGEVETPIPKNKSILSMKLGRKKKPILAVPKYPRKDKSRGNLFGLFEFNKTAPKSSFVIHPDAKGATGRKVSTGSNRTVSKITRRFSMNVFPIFKRRIFSAPPDRQSLPPEPIPTPRERSISPPPRLELTLSGSGL